MAENGKTEANEVNIEEIKDVEATEPAPKGNVHSEPDESPAMDAPPPHPH